MIDVTAPSSARVPSLASIQAAGRAAGLEAVGFTSAEPLLQARAALGDRRSRGLPEGLAFTFAKPERSTDPRATLPTARSMVVAALRYAPAGHSDDPPPRGPHGRVARVGRVDHYTRLREALAATGAPLRAEGWRTVVLADGNHLVDRAAAHRAGLGWFGRSANLLLPGEGSWFVLGAVLTDAPLGAVLTDAPLGAVLTDAPLGAVLTDAPLGAVLTDAPLGAVLTDAPLGAVLTDAPLGAVLTDAPLGAVLTDAPLGAVLTDAPLGAVLTDAPLGAVLSATSDGHLGPGAPFAGIAVPEGCGPCRLCSRACPSGAIVGPGVVDAERCLSWLAQSPAPFPRELRRVLGDRLYGCDDCQEVCPPNRVPGGGTSRCEPTSPDAEAAAHVDILQLLLADDADLLDRFGHWYLPGRTTRALRRTALVVLGNTGDARDGRVRSVLARYLGHPDAFLRAHAVWAAGALGCLDLAGEAATDLDEAVRDEWTWWQEQDLP